MMENSKEENGAWMSVPAFGEWDMKNGPPDYSMDFSKIREMRKQNKKELSRSSIGNDDDLLSRQNQPHPPPPLQPPRPRRDGHGHDHDHDHSPTGRKKFMSYFQCCIRA
uniref:RIN4 pathogenic type III effector avirulence factor Avr cleavage site domain-containing protein n=1 Tax=Ananas comosus var. bracteatus TaxID=296719 RepID=A0A6V7QV69_ANACO